MYLAIVISPAVDSFKELEESCVVPLTLGLQLGSCRQAAFFTQLHEALLQQQLATMARLREPAGSRRVDQQQCEERLQLAQLAARAGPGAGPCTSGGDVMTTVAPAGAWMEPWYQATSWYQAGRGLTSTNHGSSESYHFQPW
jgi:hypothetical protein